MSKKKTLKQEFAIHKAKTIRLLKREMFEEVREKDKVESIKDVCGIFYGLSRKARDHLVYSEILRAARLGFSPREIVRLFEAKE